MTLLSSMRVVLDTNIYISGLLVPNGNNGKILRLLERPELVLLVSQAILDELQDKLIEKFGYATEEAAGVIRDFSEMSEMVRPTSLVDAVKQDPDDNRILECALDGGADVIVSGDKKHMLALGEFRGMPILSPAEFLSRYYS